MKAAKLIFIVCALLAGIMVISVIIMNFTGYISALKTTSVSMEPSIKRGQSFFVYKTSAFKRGDIAAYRYKPKENTDSTNIVLAISRVAGIGKDKIQLKRGLLYVNDTLRDDSLKRYFFFMVSQNDLPANTNFCIENSNFFPEEDSAIINTTYTEIEKLNLKGIARRFFSPYCAGYRMFENSKESWTLEDFGPVYVPQDCYFLIGDNRSNSSDSRINGFVRKSEMEGKVILLRK